jgi:hypothetical protein
MPAIIKPFGSLRPFTTFRKDGVLYRRTNYLKGLDLLSKRTNIFYPEEMVEIVGQPPKMISLGRVRGNVLVEILTSGEICRTADMSQDMYDAELLVTIL